MLKSIPGRISLKLVVFLALIFTASCLSLKTIPTSNISELPPGRKYLKIHSEDSLWLIDQYNVKNDVLTGRIVRITSAIPESRKADVYIPSSQYVKINDGVITIPMGNIGKVDYKIVDTFMVISSISLIIFLLLFGPLIFS
jgi:hypothetical protein